MNLFKNITAGAAASNLLRSSAFKIALGVVVMTAFAKIRIPVDPIPVTLHTVGVMLLGLLYSPRLSFASVASYLLLVAGGLPLLNGASSGIAGLMGTSFGYLLGMLISAPVIGMIYGSLQKKLSSEYLRILFSTFAGHIIIFLCGVGWLSIIIGLKQAFYSGFVILIPTGIAKMVLFTMLFGYIKGWRAGGAKS